MENTLKTLEWYKSEESRLDYETADTLVKKTEYFYNYLLVLNAERCHNVNDHTQLLKLAYIMADAIDGSSLVYSSWPDILDPGKNPLLSFAERGLLQNATDMIKNAGVDVAPETSRFYVDHLADLILCSVIQKEPHFVKIDELEQPGADQFNPDLYLLEREIIQFFGNRDADPFKQGIYNRYETGILENDEDSDIFDTINSTYIGAAANSITKALQEESDREYEAERKAKRKKRRIITLIVLAAIIAAIFGGKLISKLKAEAAERALKEKYDSSNITIEINGKESEPTSSGSYTFWFPTTVKNNSTVGIKTVDGILSFSDYNNKEIGTVKCNLALDVPANQTLDTSIQFTGNRNSNAYMINDLTFEELTIYFDITKITYSDAHIETPSSDSRLLHEGVYVPKPEPVKPDNPTDPVVPDDSQQPVEPEDTPVNSGIIGYAFVLINDLNIRNSAGTDGKILTLAKQWQSYPVYEVVNNWDYNWYRIGEDQWIADDNGQYLVFSTDKNNKPNPIFFGDWTLMYKDGSNYYTNPYPGLIIGTDGTWIRSGAGGGWMSVGEHCLFLMHDQSGDGKLDHVYLTLYLYNYPSNERDLDSILYLTEYTAGNKPLGVLIREDGDFDSFYVKAN